VIVIGSMISLGYYLPVIAAMWMGQSTERPQSLGSSPLPRVAGAGGELEGQSAEAPGRAPEVALTAILAGAATLFFGILPGPLLDLVRHAGRGLGLF
ncbi:MAG: hypothetical protein ACRDK2_13215, partial [Solirubrobacteraceae bacterium]